MSDQENSKEKEIERVLKFYNDSISAAATEFVKYLGSTLLGWKGVLVNVVYNPQVTNLWTAQGGPVVQAIISIGPQDKDFKKVLYDIAREAQKLYNPLENASGYKVKHNKKDKIISKKGEPYFVIPLKYCEVSSFRSITMKGPDGVSVTIEDKTGTRLESDMLFEARIKLSALIQWDNREKE